MIRVRSQRHTVMLLLAALLLRAAIPDGYMPAAAGSGLLFVLCPSGVPAGFMQALAGPDHHHHHSDNTESAYDAGQCPIGHMLSSAMAFDDLSQPAVMPQLPKLTPTPLRVLVSRTSADYRTRGPPA
jgi:hypothetical protein